MILAGIRRGCDESKHNKLFLHDLRRRFYTSGIFPDNVDGVHFSSGCEVGVKMLKPANVRIYFFNTKIIIISRFLLSLTEDYF